MLPRTNAAVIDEWVPQIISKQPFRSTVTRIDQHTVEKRGGNVYKNEEAALRLVRQHAPGLPVPEVYHSIFKTASDGSQKGIIFMSYIEGKTLQSVWPSLSGATKERICHDTWRMIAKIRQVPRPGSLDRSAYYSTVDGSPIHHPMLGDYNDPCPKLTDDEAFRARANARYVKHNGLSYADGKDLPKMLPRSKCSVFTHGDIHPGNIFLNDSYQIVGLVDWESAGFFPDYWEYSQMMRPMHDSNDEWQEFMRRSSPKEWDVTGIEKARRVLF
ncbi:kinase-like protein [Coniochaeta ligniaria NRRL 30616]|uniref:Kinase-like protein n=1 Tax=Coniochaeta ligniaria NRRL 30616 TaxID=1408157 RepID=A0A1J7J845_9PEZI|nr:kinase-like protein [Coniochaeta ligniaria NRRL 30616]